MKAKRLTHLATIVLFATGSTWCLAQTGHKMVNEGNKLFAEEKYDEANTKYRDAMLDAPDSPIIHFNIGDVQYKKHNYEEALKTYQKALSSDDITVQSKAYYNMGNTLYKLGKLPESILHYRKALELNPDDEDAKYNLEYVRAKLKDNSNKQQQQNPQQNQQKQDKQNQQGQQNKDQQKDSKDQKKQEQKKEDKQKQQQRQDGKKQDSDDQQQQQQRMEKKEISKQDAERILNALQKDEQDLLKKQRKVKARGAFHGKDW